MAAIEPVRWAHDRLELLDQTLLPLREVVRHYARAAQGEITEHSRQVTDIEREREFDRA